MSITGTRYRQPVHKYEVSTITDYEDMKSDKNAKIVVFWEVRGHPRSLETSPFDRVHMTAYLTLIETIRKFNRFDTIPQCDRHTHTHRQTDTRRRHIPRLA